MREIGQLKNWEKELIRRVRQLHKPKKPCTIVIRYDGRTWNIHDCLSPSAKFTEDEIVN